MDRRPWAGPAPALLVVTVLFGGALVGAVRTSVAPLPGQAANLEAWRRVIVDPRFLQAAVFTLVIAAVATTISAVLALPLAGLLRTRRPLQAVAMLPVLAPHLLVAVLAALWLGPGGLADRLIDGLPVLVRDPLGLGVLLVYLVKEIPFLAMLLIVVWDDDVVRREEVAATLGLSPRQRIQTVVWPAVRAPLVLGSTIVSAFVLGSLQIPAVVGPTSPVTVPQYALEATRIRGLEGQADAAVALLLASGVALLIAVIAGLMVRRLDGVRA